MWSVRIDPADNYTANYVIYFYRNISVLSKMAFMSIRFMILFTEHVTLLKDLEPLLYYFSFGWFAFAAF